MKSDPATIRSAIEDLEDNLRKGMAPEDAVEAAASDNGCARELLNRAFRSKHQRSPSEWEPPLSRLDMARQAAAAQARRQALSAAEHDPLYGHGRVPTAQFLVAPGTIIAVASTEFAVSYLLDRSWDRPHARIAGVAVDPAELATSVGMHGENQAMLYLKLIAGELALPGFDCFSLAELRQAVLEAEIRYPGAPSLSGAG